MANLGKIGHTSQLTMQHRFPGKEHRRLSGEKVFVNIINFTCFHRCKSVNVTAVKASLLGYPSILGFLYVGDGQP